MSPWQALGIESTTDVVAIRRAYAARLKLARPDDDAAAYQALREAYDWALGFARAMGTIQAFPATPLQTEPPFAVETQETAVDDPHYVFELASEEPNEKDDPSAALSPHALAERVRFALRDGTEAQIDRIWPELAPELDALPLTARSEASRLFAQIAIENPTLPIALLRGLQQHFGWGVDFRTDQAMGRGRAEALRNLLLTPREAGPAFDLDEDSWQKRYIPVREFGTLAKRLSNWQLYLYALLASSALGRLWSELSPEQRRYLGIDTRRQGRCGKALTFGCWGRALVVIFVCSLVVQMPEYVHRPWPVRMAGMFGFGLGLAFVLYMQYLFTDMDPEHKTVAWPAQRADWFLPCWLVVGTGVCWVAESNGWPRRYTDSSTGTTLVGLLIAIFVVPLAVDFFVGRAARPATAATRAMPAILMFCIGGCMYLPPLADLPWSRVFVGTTWFAVARMAHTAYGVRLERAWGSMLNDFSRRWFCPRQDYRLRDAGIPSIYLLRLTIGWPYTLMNLATRQSSLLVTAIVCLTMVALPTVWRAWLIPATLLVTVGFIAVSAIAAYTARVLNRPWRESEEMLLPMLLAIGLGAWVTVYVALLMTPAQELATALFKNRASTPLALAGHVLVGGVLPLGLIAWTVERSRKRRSAIDTD